MFKNVKFIRGIRIRYQISQGLGRYLLKENLCMEVASRLVAKMVMN
jgi:hypothetical protein